jgi:hypothetical protein
VTYDLLFRASSQAVQKLASDPRLIGGQILVGVLSGQSLGILATVA